MNKVKLTLDQTNWIEATWEKEIITQVEGEEDKVETTQVWCESYSGHPEHIGMLRAKASEFETSLEEFETLIKECKNNFILPTDEEIEAEKRKQFEIQFRYDREVLLKKVDIEINKAEDLGEDTKSLRLYRQALRDATINWIMPESIL